MNYEDQDYVGCPCCGSSVAVVIEDFGMEYASCQYDCGYKWHMLIEPDPDYWNESRLNTPIIPFEGDLDDIMYEDKERYRRILEWSDLGESSYENDSKGNTVPWNISMRQRKFFERYGMEISWKEDEYKRRIVKNFMSDNEDLQNLLWVLITACGMEAIYEKGVENPRVVAIKCDQFQMNGFKILTEPDHEDFMVRFKEKLNMEYGISFFEIEYVPEESKELKTFNELYKGVKEEKGKIPTEFKSEFLNQKTSFNLTVGELMKEIKNCEPINPILPNPIIVPYDEYMNNFSTYQNYPSMIDLENKIVFVSISHKFLMQELLKDSDLPFDKLERKFHNVCNMIQYAVSELSGNRILALTKDDIIDFKKVLDKENISYQTTILSDNIDDFVVLNGSGSVEGEIYFPKPEEELDVKGKILVIPTSSEEYFLPALSVMEGNGCIITERGSKMSHLVSNSREFDFKIILVENATNLFKNGEEVFIDLDNKKIVRI